jgi:hypothetical protein
MPAPAAARSAWRAVGIGDPGARWSGIDMTTAFGMKTAFAIR